ADEDYVRDLTTKLGVELAVGHGNISSEGNLEQNARNARYDFLTQTAENLHAFAVVTGHTINDQAETFLINLIRGSGPDGLSGMKPLRILEEEKGGKGEEKTVASDNGSPLLPLSPSTPLLIRPLLRWAKRIDTEGFCRESEVEYRYDTMNEDTAFKRVRIRKILLPLLEDFNPKIIDTLAQTATLMAGVCGTAESASEAKNNNRLELSDLRLLDHTERQNTIRTWLKQHRGMTRGLELKHIEAVSRLVLSAKSGRVAELPGGGRVIKSGGKLVYEENKVEN
ncbi:MAG TPA: tRNA lysidine(34) synthetase TilS, partial [Pyrinomonadaceae bacterium]|nr:tRNA lysidine(34) synthetase TilS [Pyrinomonadaceae bacterium]